MRLHEQVAHRDDVVQAGAPCTARTPGAPAVGREFPSAGHKRTAAHGKQMRYTGVQVIGRAGYALQMEVLASQRSTYMLAGAATLGRHEV